MNLVKKVENFFSYLGSLGIFIKGVFYFLFTRKRDFKTVSKEIVFIGIDSLFLVSLISFRRSNCCFSDSIPTQKIFFRDLYRLLGSFIFD